MFKTRSGTEVEFVSYGDLKKIFVLSLPPDVYWGTLGGTTLILMLVVPWNTRGKSATEENVYMTSRLASVMTDVQNLEAVVGLVKTQNRWGIIDRMLGTVSAQFADDERTVDSDNDG
ncbi:hypothetical protein HD554DRAFT_2012432 [Boletus coccyginus]|nr:hypothetical protein HD554DRAFT_2012432 [Boletus coccyginus]